MADRTETRPILPRDKLRVPTYDEWANATSFEREWMTWPKEILNRLDREQP